MARTKNRGTSMKEIASLIMSLSITAFSVLPFTAGPSSQPIKTGDYAPITIAKAPNDYSVIAKSAYIEDARTRAVIYENNPQEKLPIASLTKLMTVYLILHDKKLDDTVTIPKEVASVQGGQSAVINLVPGDKMTARQLVQASLIPSANDAAIALAIWHSGSVQDFVDKMNDTARELGMDNTSFKNPTGLDTIGHVSTAQDLALLTHYLLEDDFFRTTVNTKTTTITSEQGRKYVLNTTNELLNNAPSVRGVKTGYTQAAGECLITLSEREGREVITVILGSTDRFGESRNMINLAFSLHYE
ncbi:D-alanyl-D-alanine carboxypeptidase [bacterium]|nr:MAG: D-alanyl-D-alanine carboxypeptidase [bacterium]